MDYNTLIAAKSTDGSVASWTLDSRIVGSVPAIIDDAMAAIFRRLRHWRMLTKVDIQLTQGSDTIALPDDFLESVQLSITGTEFGILRMRTPEYLDAGAQFDAQGNRAQAKPMAYAVAGTNIELDYVADKTYPATLRYYAQPAALSATNPTNFLTVFYPRLVRCAIMMCAVEWMKESGQGSFDRTYWAQLTQAEITAAQAESDRVATRLRQPVTFDTAGDA